MESIPLCYLFHIYLYAPLFLLLTFYPLFQYHPCHCKSSPIIKSNKVYLIFILVRKDLVILSPGSDTWTTTTITFRTPKSTSISANNVLLGIAQLDYATLYITTNKD